jgi:tetratricopeptide (TPR) repeat protein
MEKIIICDILVLIVMEFNMSKYGIHRFLRFSMMLLFVLIFSLQNMISQEKTNFNQFYKFPISIGLDYAELTPFSDVGFDSTLTEIALNVRYPIPSIPQLQPSLQLGALSFDDLERSQEDKWDHTHYFGSLGAMWAHRFSKTFEVSGELSTGISYALYPNVNPSGVAASSTNLLVSTGLRVSLNPSYNLSLDVHPSLKYMKYIGDASNFDLFDGFSFGIGFSGHYRFGKDPDAPQAIIRSIKFEVERLPSIFAAMQSYYVTNPIGKVTITNTEDFSIYDVDVSFFQAGYMDNPTKAVTLTEMEAGETVEVDLFASFNDAVFSKNGVTPLTGEVNVDYIWRNRPVNQVASVSYDLHDKTALTWDDDRKVGAFITSADSALRNYASAIRQYTKDDTVPNFSDALQAAMQIYYGLAELGIIYQIDPTSPFDAAQDNPQIVDSISIPRDTLTRLTGDCDDLTAVYTALLETLGIETAFITVPGHIYAAFNTGVPSKDFRKVHNDKSMTLSVDGTLWVPVEITLMGTDDFLSAWRIGIMEFAAVADTPDLRNINKTREAQEIFRPVGLTETDLGLQYGSKAEIVKNFKRDMDKLIDNVIDDYKETASASKRKRDFNKLGIIAAQFGRVSAAEEAFNGALSLDRNYLNPKINLGNLYYMEEEYQDALRNFLGAERTLVEAEKQSSAIYPKILLNIARTYYELENYDRVSEYYDRVTELDPALTAKYTYLHSDSGGSRASDAGSFSEVLFVDEE